MEPLIIIILLAIYLLPSMIALARRHHQRGAIITLNIFLGWLGLGWIAALVWSFSAVRQETPVTNN